MNDMSAMLSRLDELFGKRAWLEKEYIQNEEDIYMLQELIMYESNKEARR